MTQQKSIQKTYQISTLYVQDFLAKVFQLLEDDEDSTTSEVRYSLKLPESLPIRNLHICYLKTFPDCYLMTAGGRLQPSSMSFQNWGMMSAGRCLTARISAFLNPEKECTLSAILERNAPQKYFLSATQMERLLYKSCQEDQEAECTAPSESE